MVKATQRENRFELSESLPLGKFSNPDLEPVPIKDRTWGTYAIASLWAGMSICIPSWMLAASGISAGLNLAQATGLLILGQIIVLVPMLLNAHVGPKYGISYPIYARSSFGFYGSNFPGLLRTGVAIGWCAVQAWVGGMAINKAIGLVSPAWRIWDSSTLVTHGLGTGLSVGSTIGFIIMLGLSIAILWTKFGGIKKLAEFAAPIMLIIGIGLFIWGYDSAGGMGPYASSEGLKGSEFWAAGPAYLTGMIAYWSTLALNFPDFTRYSKSQSEMSIGSAIGLIPFMGLFGFLGIAVASMSEEIFGGGPIWDPLNFIGAMAEGLGPLGVGLVLVGLVFIILATLTTNVAANMVAPVNVITNLSPKHLSFRKAGVIVACIALVAMPWYILSSYETYLFVWLNGYGGILGSVAGVMICDYWIIRKRRLHLLELYQPQKSRYWYAHGFNPAGIISVVMGIAVVLGSLAIPGLRAIYDYSWFSSFAIGLIMYWTLMRFWIMGRYCVQEQIR